MESHIESQRERQRREILCAPTGGTPAACRLWDEVADKKQSKEEDLKQKIMEIDESFTVHDFRMVCGEKRTNVLFDVAVPFGSCVSKDFIKGELERQITAIDDNYCLIVTVEHTVL